MITIDWGQVGPDGVLRGTLDTLVGLDDPPHSGEWITVALLDGRTTRGYVLFADPVTNVLNLALSSPA